MIVVLLVFVKLSILSDACVCRGFTKGCKLLMFVPLHGRLSHNSFHFLQETPQSFRHFVKGLLLLFQLYYEIRQYVGHTLNVKRRAFYSKFIFSDLFLNVMLMRKCNY